MVETTGEVCVEGAALGACQADGEDAGAYCEIPAVADCSDRTQAGQNRTMHRVINLHEKITCPPLKPRRKSLVQVMVHPCFSFSIVQNTVIQRQGSHHKARTEGGRHARHDCQLDSPTLSGLTCTTVSH